MDSTLLFGQWRTDPRYVMVGGGLLSMLYFHTVLKYWNLYHEFPTTLQNENTSCVERWQLAYGNLNRSPAYGN